MANPKSDPNPIMPTVGRMVLVRGPHSSKDLPGIITEVVDENTIHLTLLRTANSPIPILGAVYSSSEEPPNHGYAWRWMTYQKQVAAGEAPSVKQV